MKTIVRGFFDKDTWTVTYVVYESVGSPAIVIDSVLNFDQKSGRTSTQSADQLIEFIGENQLKIEWILETHAHADHLTAAPYLQSKVGGKIAIGNHIQEVQQVFKNIFNLESAFKVDGSQFDYLINDAEEIPFGNLKFKAISVPGHTPACLAYEVVDAVFVGDTIFMPDVGTARCDFPGGNASTLFHSIKKLLSKPDETRLFLCHDYPPTDRPIAFQTTVAAQRAQNIHIHDGVNEAQFVEMRTSRDRGLEMPTLLLPSIQVNIRAGHLPPNEDNGVSYLKIPLNAL
ncbi:MBL fold metallo-hydrolase [Polynucleobacter sphagniphilus]|uniref:Glyoxylase-like metal-dependent hydrolase (Beta-lactamase superfamily II) n=1 Tax=Polynucleobacter sphagniphilus TaxID=1743169 RepID=A0AA43S449_9BURK|nr:MBL fold metallo-hydrolase [Polynucleobacter sphagniphilus]MDF9789196.1 glyoxylase-like metal-dependent hydrolase (beta-lactamase superfamily II) [Polynucleobacter sphagniphilus]MDH6503094.1 glyoxylase-like metal-dependent hydrolase (beta-lactamase superfamily II) [Polynucleobacter sphagniphilus]MDH6511755.1 glyoxylase-like metal-dependent hydrolase (beta-lactamase superfamily II) [Polynucleobacter sphagniphilus]OLY95549.1 MBL fold metallo-hydrolase [Polynucleobacter sphagniphilus]